MKQEIKDKIKSKLLEENYRIYSKNYPKLYDSLYSLIDKLKEGEIEELKTILRVFHMKIDGLTKRSDETEDAFKDISKE